MIRLFLSSRGKHPGGALYDFPLILSGNQPDLFLTYSFQLSTLINCYQHLNLGCFSTFAPEHQAQPARTAKAQVAFFKQKPGQ
jgi:hypothetical protein